MSKHLSEQEGRLAHLSDDFGPAARCRGSRESIEEILFMPGDQSEWNRGHKVNLWTEWAKLKGSIITGSSYSAPEVRNEYAALLVSLARQEWPDTSILSDPEVVWKLAKRRLTGLVVSSPDDRRVAELIDS